MLDRIPARKTRKGFPLIVLDPEVSSQKVVNRLLLPGVVDLPVKACPDLEAMAQNILEGRDDTGMGMSCSVLAEDVRCGTVRVAVCGNGRSPVDQSVGSVGRKRFPLGFGPPAPTAGECHVDRILHRNLLPAPDVLQGEIGLEIVVETEIEDLAVAVAPVLVVAQAIFTDLGEGKPRRALLMFLRRTEGCEYDGVFLAETLAETEHVGIGVDGSRVHVAGATHMGQHHIHRPAFRKRSARDFDIALHRPVVRAVEAGFCSESL